MFVETMSGRGPRAVERILRNSLFLLQEESERALEALGVEEVKPHRTPLERQRHEVCALEAELAVKRQEQQSNGIVCMLVKTGGLRVVPNWLWQEAEKKPKLRKQLAAAVEYRLAHPML